MRIRDKTLSTRMCSCNPYNPTRAPLKSHYFRCQPSTNLWELSKFGLSANLLETHKSVKQFAFLRCDFCILVNTNRKVFHKLLNLHLNSQNEVIIDVSHLVELVGFAQIASFSIGSFIAKLLEIRTPLLLNRTSNTT